MVVNNAFETLKVDHYRESLFISIFNNQFKVHIITIIFKNNVMQYEQFGMHFYCWPFQTTFIYSIEMMNHLEVSLLKLIINIYNFYFCLNWGRRSKVCIWIIIVKSKKGTRSPYNSYHSLDLLQNMQYPQLPYNSVFPSVRKKITPNKVVIIIWKKWESNEISLQIVSDCMYVVCVHRLFTFDFEL